MSNDSFTKGYIETGASARRRSKEDIRVQELVPSGILQDSSDNGSNQRGIETLLDAYYRFMNLNEFTFLQEETYTALVLDDGTVNFRISDRELENNKFFSQSQLEEQTVLDVNGIEIVGTDNVVNLLWSNGNNIPKILEDGFNKGKTLTIKNVLSSYIGQIITLNTQTINYRKDGPSSVMNGINDAMNIDVAAEEFLDMMQKEIAAHIPKNLTADKRNLYKKIIEYYKIRGSADSIETFFRLLFNDEVEVEYPYESTLIPSSGNWDDSQNLYLDNKGFVSDDIKLHDSYFYQKFSYVIKTARNIEEWEDIFTRLVHPAGFIFFGEILVVTQLVRSILTDNVRNINDLYGRSNRFTLSSMPGQQPGVIGIEDLALIIELMAPSFGQAIVAKNNDANRVGAINPKDLTASFLVNTLSATYANTSVVAGVGTNTLESKSALSTTLSMNMTDRGAEISEPLTNDWYEINPTNGLIHGFNYFTDSVSNAIVDAVIVIDKCLLDFNAKNVSSYSPSSSYVFKAGFDYINVSVNGGAPTRITENLIQYVVIDNSNTNMLVLGIKPGVLPTISATNTVTINVGGYDKYKSLSSPKYRDQPEFDVDAFVFGAGDQAEIKARLKPTSISQIDITRYSLKTYSESPPVVISAPESGVQAVAYAVLDSSGRITGIKMLNKGSGYTSMPVISIPSDNTASPIAVKGFLEPTPIDYVYVSNSGSNYYNTPRIRLATDLVDEVRAHQQPVVKTFIHGSNIRYYERKGDYVDHRIYNMNLQINHIGDKQIQNITAADINNINTNTFISKLPDDEGEIALFGSSNEEASFGLENESPTFGIN
jgi:hypothetical protein